MNARVLADLQALLARWSPSCALSRNCQHALCPLIREIEAIVGAAS